MIPSAYGEESIKGQRDKYYIQCVQVLADHPSLTNTMNNTFKYVKLHVYVILTTFKIINK